MAISAAVALCESVMNGLVLVAMRSNGYRLLAEASIPDRAFGVVVDDLIR